MIKTSVAAAISIFALTLSAQTASAAVVTHCGPTICYEYDNAQTATALFGQPTFAGDTVRFLPPSFRAQSDDGAGFDTATANFIFSDVYTLSGNDIGIIFVREAGDYEITNDGDATVDLFLQAASNVDFFDITSTTESLDFNGDSGGLQRWTLDASLNPTEDPFWFGDANSMAVNIQNTLQAFTDANGESAWIQKKITLVAAEVPIPAAVWLFGSALVGLGWMKRRQ